MSATGRKRRTTFAAAAIGSAVAALLLAGHALAAPGWLAPHDVSERDAGAPQIVMDAAGNATAIWEQYDGEEHVIQAASRSAGGAWEPPVTVAAADEEYRHPQLAIDEAGNVTALWVRGLNAAILSASKPANGPWGPVVPVREFDNMGSDVPQLTVDAAGNATAAWIEDDGSNYRVTAARRPVGSGAWGPPVWLSAADAEVEEPLVAAAGNGDVVAAWTVDTGADDRVQVSRRPAGGDWDEPIYLSPEGGHARQHQMVAGGDDVVVVWARRDESSNYRIQSSTMAAGGSWDIPATLSQAGTSAHDPQIAIDDAGNATATWTRSDGSHSRVQVTSKGASGDSWSEPVYLSDEGAAAGEPKVAADAVTTVVVWERNDGADDRAQASTRAAGAAWQAATNLSEPGGDADLPEVVVDGSGNAFAIWEYNDADDPVQAAAYDNALPELRSLSIPTTGKVGEPLSFSVSPFDAFAPLGPVQWSFGDGGSTSGDAVTHAYASPGDYTVRVEVADVLGNEASAAGAVQVAGDTPPPPPPGPPGPNEAEASAKRKVKVNLKRGVAVVTLRCPQAGSCTGAVKLGTKGKRSKPLGRTKKKVDLAAGGRGQARVKLNRKGKKRLRRAAKRKRQMKANLTGSAVERRTVVLQLRRR